MEKLPFNIELNSIKAQQIKKDENLALYKFSENKYEVILIDKENKINKINWFIDKHISKPTIKQPGLKAWLFSKKGEAINCFYNIQKIQQFNKRQASRLRIVP